MQRPSAYRCGGMACWVGGWGTHMPRGVGGNGLLGGWLGYSYAQGCVGEWPAGWVAGVLIRPGVCWGMGWLGYSYAQGCVREWPAGWVAGVLICPGVCGGMPSWVGGWGTRKPSCAFILLLSVCPRLPAALLSCYRLPAALWPAGSAVVDEAGLACGAHV